MTIGILTLHDSTNYGAVLQTYALYSVLASMGHDVRIIDRRRNSQLYAIGYPYSGDSFLTGLLRYLSFTGACMEAVHRRNTYNFERRNLCFTSYFFHDWKEAPQDLGLDMIVVGSDQVWNDHLQDPLDYTLARIPGGVPGITYAASMGKPCLPVGMHDYFAEWIPKFSAVSVRERSLLPVMESLGVKAKHVVDPVLLIGKKFWNALTMQVPVEKKRAFVYTLGMEDLMTLLKKMNSFAKTNACKVEVFPCRHFLPLPNVRSLKGVLRLPWNIMYWVRLRSFSRVRVRLTAGPLQFLESLASSENVITNSFHALLFGAILGKNVRFVIPNDKSGKEMMVRINDYVGKFFIGPILQPSVDAAIQSIESGVKSYVNSAELEEFRQESMSWLVNELKNVHVLRNK